MPKPVEFRTALSGFNKKDVNQYIADLSAELSRESEEAKAKLDEITAELESEREGAEAAKRELEEMKAKLDAMSVELDTKNAALLQAERNCSELSAKLEGCENEKKALEAELEKTLGECDRLKAENAELPSLRENAKSYEAMSHELGDMIISAKKTSCEIIAGAQADADDMRASTDAELQLIRADAEKKAGNALEVVSDLLHTMAEETFGEMMTYASEAQFTVGAMFEELKRKSTEINDRIRYINSSSNASLREKLDALPTAVDVAKISDGKNVGGEK